MSESLAVIPARYASSRLPGKPLIELAGRPMIEHVWRRAHEAGLDRVLVATDDERIAEAVRAFGGEVSMTRGDHVNGTARLAEVAGQLGLADDTCVVNVQGDEPLLPPTMIERVRSRLLEDEGAAMATLAEPLEDHDALMRPGVVKVVCDARGRALYFSRAPIPWDRDRFDGGAAVSLAAGPWRRHVGLYAYRAGFLGRYAALSEAPMERLEQLEQLRALYHGYAISVADSSEHWAPGVDTPEDVVRIRAIMEAAR
ncbi:3-deoxy-manno-octulosonate cytidylyltransferase (CMP-KDO synthetase) [Kushneria sinocarnis]|uniref:3-deoxy-manno-octulosonate cytidylyltransferase n=1 Tax=Kushneria sinocarnis TaxID=595502 RepID=A0A420WYV3_9GAMM|nr:3-deoxy-manno-octulosonate cytidylyltransferase [Kushneria sinocarnis]RKR06363.1 3-deoxy-manno-octulosonate cytidylyltransferase (CMP-KDO synthetase) [Kushneria sinocarnis]